MPSFWHKAAEISKKVGTIALVAAATAVVTVFMVAALAVAPDWVNSLGTSSKNEAENKPKNEVENKPKSEVKSEPSPATSAPSVSSTPSPSNRSLAFALANVLMGGGSERRPSPPITTTETSADFSNRGRSNSSRPSVS